MSPVLFILYPDLFGGQAGEECQILSGTEPFWLIATVRGGEPANSLIRFYSNEV